MAIVAGVLALVLVAGCGLVIGRGGIGDVVARLSPIAKLGLYGAVLILVAATAWTLGSAVGPIHDQPSPPVEDTGHSDHDR
ncbi:hypothetical protein ACFYOT_40555 [Saccharothrix saharensis]|uniref:hypothetical protein n=1 Tax=Saccharothrix saharensis TaxID=571190 RepID=UPI0036C8CBBA